jgi:regulator of cell morphogenesis and NO signaling
MLTEQLQTLKVYELEPRKKHPAIFEWFDKLQPAQSFIIENDHDPLPLYYELKAERNGKLGGFDYLQKGPEIWKVQITKAGETEQSYRDNSINREITTTPEEAGQSYNSCSTKKTVTDSTKILDVTKLEPRLKHPTIFEWFNELKPGESFALINDHDPKPLYYQMLAQLGYVFSWEYTEVGPVWWKVVIQKNKHGELTVGEIAAKDIRKAQTMKRLGVDFCCGGNRTINQAAAEAGIPAEDLQKALKETEYSAPDVNLAFDKWDADFLINYIYTRHHNYYYDTRENILQLAIKVRQVHGQNHPELVKLTELIEKLFRELNIHFYKEENVLFPYIEELVVFKKEGTRPRSQISLAQGPLAMMHMEHEEAGDILKEMRSITNDYLVPDNACSSFRLLYTELKDLENDLHQHIHLENNILFPKAMQLEKELYSLD